MQTAAGKVFDVDRRCPFTSSNSAWVLMENVATQHGEPVAHGEQGGKAGLALNNLVEVKHVALLSSWHKSFYFRYFGPGREADEKFLSGECSMLTSDSSLYLRLLRRKPFGKLLPFDVAEMAFIAGLPWYRKALPDRRWPTTIAQFNSDEFVSAQTRHRLSLLPQSQRDGRQNVWPTRFISR